MLLQCFSKMKRNYWIHGFFPSVFWTHPYQNRWNLSENWRFLVVHLRGLVSGFTPNPSRTTTPTPMPPRPKSRLLWSRQAQRRWKGRKAWWIYLRHRLGLLDAVCPFDHPILGGSEVWDINTCSISKVWGANRHTQEADKYFNPSTSILGVRNFEPGSYKTCYVCRSSESLIISYQ